MSAKYDGPCRYAYLTTASPSILSWCVCAQCCPVTIIPAVCLGGPWAAQPMGHHRRQADAALPAGRLRGLIRTCHVAWPLLLFGSMQTVWGQKACGRTYTRALLLICVWVLLLHRRRIYIHRRMARAAEQRGIASAMQGTSNAACACVMHGHVTWAMKDNQGQSTLSPSPYQCVQQCL